MKRLCSCVLTLAGFLAASTAFAQPQIGRPPTNPLGTPGFTPYLNMLRGGDPALNYYGLVRPQLETRGALQQLQQQNLATQQGTPMGDSTFVMPVTGHSVLFQNYSHYYRFPGQASSGGSVSPLGSYGNTVPYGASTPLIR